MGSLSLSSSQIHTQITKTLVWLVLLFDPMTDPGQLLGSVSEQGGFAAQGSQSHFVFPVFRERFHCWPARKQETNDSNLPPPSWVWGMFYGYVETPSEASSNWKGWHQASLVA